MIGSEQEKPVTLGPGAMEVVESESTAGRGGDHYDLVLTGDRVGAIQVGEARIRQTRRGGRLHDQSERQPILPSPENRLGFRAAWKAAREAADAMVQASAIKDMPGLGIAADDLQQALAKLWELRLARDLDWQTILNHAQEMMRQFFARMQVEELTQDQCRKILTIIEDHLGPATKSVDDLNEVLRLIEDAGFDPYAAISGDPLESGPVQE